MLSSSSSEKTRLAAVVSLARLGDKRALKPLVARAPRSERAGPRDRRGRARPARPQGRAARAATAANDDADASVRARAHDAAIAVAKREPAPRSVPRWPSRDRARRRGRARRRPRGLRPPGRTRVDDHPDLYIMINSSADDSPGRADKQTRKLHARHHPARRSPTRSGRAPNVTTVAADAQRWGLDPRHIDLSVDQARCLAGRRARSRSRPSSGSRSPTTSGKMLSFLSGGAKVQVPKRTFNAKYLPAAPQGGARERDARHVRQAARAPAAISRRARPSSGGASVPSCECDATRVIAGP